MDIILQNDVIERIATLIKERNLIPVFGAGFSMNSKAYGGVVPSGDKTTVLMKEILLQNCSDLQLDEIEDCDFNETAKLFYNLTDDIKNDFFEKYFTSVKLGELQKDFLKFSWPYASKAALTTALISCMIYKKEDIAEKDFYLGEAVVLGYEAVNSDFYRFNEGYLNNELVAKKRRMSSYELLIEARHIYEDTHIMGDYVERARKLVDKLNNLKEQYSRK